MGIQKGDGLIVELLKEGMGGEDEMKGKERKRMRLIGRKNPKMEKDLQNFVRIFFFWLFSWRV